MMYLINSINAIEFKEYSGKKQNLALTHYSLLITHYSIHYSLLKMVDSQKLLEQYFDTAFAAPDGVKRLRELILSLAMRGKLVPQNPEDQPARQLLREIKAEKKRLVKEKKIKRSKALPEITPEEIPYDLPESWEWVRLGQITEYNGRENIKPKEIQDNIWLLDLEDIEKDTSRIIYRAKYCERISKSTKSVFKQGDVLYGKLRPYLNKVVVADNDGVCTTEIVPIIPYSGIDSYFLKWLLKRPSFLQYVNSLMYGVKMPRLGTSHAVESLHPLPPLEEQKRIVEKIDRLFEQVDRLEELRNQREQQRLIVHAAASYRLLHPQNEQEFKDTWRFIGDHFGHLYAVKENVSELRKAILQLAVMGKLVPQDPTDPPASELLKDIAAEKQRLLKEGKIPKPKKVSEINEEDLPYWIPPTWKWTRTELICAVIVDCPHSTPKFTSEGLLCIDTNSFKSGVLLEEKFRYVSEDTFSERVKRLTPQENDIIFAREGSIGESVIVPKNMQCCLGQRVMLFRTMQQIFCKYLQLSLSTPSFLSRLLDLHKGIGAKHVNVGDMRNALIPLPPLPEQHRIVEKVDRLMNLCDQLEASIDQRTDKQTSLLNAVMAGMSNEF